MKKIMVVFLVLIVLFMITNHQSNEVMIPQESIRFRVIANSDQDQDQKNKKIIAQSLQKDISNQLKEVNNLDQSRKALKSNIQTFKTTIEDTLKNHQIEESYTIDYGDHYFPQKEYKGVTYKEGLYESLVVTLGNGLGENFWCVLFPPLCLLEAEEENTKEIEYKSFVKEVINKYF